MRRHFNQKELSLVDEAVRVSEELVNNHYKMSSGGWLRNRYDILTQKDLSPDETVSGPVAQVVKYEARKKDVPLGSSAFSLYRICLQDNTILLTAKREDLSLPAFLLYILCHELVHVVRFSRYEHRYENSGEAGVTRKEEHRVHGITHVILKQNPVSGMSQVFEFYSDWFCEERDLKAVKKKEKLS